MAGALALLTGAAPPKRAAPRAGPVVQKVTPPKTVYWLSAATTSGFGAGMSAGAAPSMGDMMRMMQGGSNVTKSLQLDLGGGPATAQPAAAAHTIPPGMAMGPTLLLKSPQRSTGTPGREPEDFERPKGRILLFWGCGETARTGQPLTIDFSAMAAGQIPPGLFGGTRVRIARPPSAANWPSHGHWPNDDAASSRGVPGGASLIGAHRLTGNYLPAIDFDLTEDFMGALAMTQSKLPSGALALGWNALPMATGHFAQVMGSSGNDQNGATIVFWTSSETQGFVSGLGDYVSPAEAARLVTAKQLMPPGQTSCTIPREVLAAAPQGMVSLTAHGPEENIIFPPRPADPRNPWNQLWAVKARFVARTGAIAGMDMASMERAGNDHDRQNGRPRKPKCPVDSGAAAGKAVGGALAGSMGSALGGMFGRKKKPQDCEP